MYIRTATLALLLIAAPFAAAAQGSDRPENQAPCAIEAYAAPYGKPVKIHAAPRRDAAMRGTLPLSRDEEGRAKGAYVTITAIDGRWAKVTGVTAWDYDNNTASPDGWVEARHLRMVLQTHSGFAAPDPQSRVMVAAPDWLMPGQIKQLEDCRSNWVKVAVRSSGRRISAWFRGACANQETTCDGTMGDPLPASRPDDPVPTVDAGTGR
jgi:hypothetical protein